MQAKICNGCHHTFPVQKVKRGRCPGCQRADNRRRNAKRAEHGRSSQWWRSFRSAYLGSSCEHCGSTADLTLHYKPGGRHSANPADYETLCRSCHGAVDAPRAHAITG